MTYVRFLKCLFNHLLGILCGWWPYVQPAASGFVFLLVPVLVCKATCMKVYSVPILSLNLIHGTWIPLDMAVTWLITSVGFTKQSRDKGKIGFFFFPFFVSLRNTSNRFENISIFVYLPPFNLCMCVITHIVWNGIPENFNQVYVNIVPAIVIFLAAFMYFLIFYV